jgi:beta-lactamase superfamily II metal-dependent hydrolase
VVVHLRRPARRIAGIALLVAVAGWPLIAPAGSRRPSGLVLLDVGQGQATLVVGGGEAVLVDAGDDRARTGTRAALGQLRQLGIRRVEMLVLSHPDRDHAGGASIALAAARPRLLALPAASFDAPAFEPVHRAAARRGVAVVAFAAGDAWERGVLAIRAFHPAAGASTQTNDESLVLHVAAGDLRAMIPGDAGAPVERNLAAQGLLRKIDVLVAGHHGARSCTSDVLLDATRPGVVLISAGAGNRYGHPHPETLTRLASAGLRPLTTANWGPLSARSLTNGLLVVEAGKVGAAVARRRGRDVRSH